MNTHTHTRLHKQPRAGALRRKRTLSEQAQSALVNTAALGSAGLRRPPQRGREPRRQRRGSRGSPALEAVAGVGGEQRRDWSAPAVGWAVLRREAEPRGCAPRLGFSFSINKKPDWFLVQDFPPASSRALSVPVVWSHLWARGKQPGRRVRGVHLQVSCSLARLFSQEERSWAALRALLFPGGEGAARPASPVLRLRLGCWGRWEPRESPGRARGRASELSPAQIARQKPGTQGTLLSRRRARQGLPRAQTRCQQVRGPASGTRTATGLGFALLLSLGSRNQAFCFEILIQFLKICLSCNRVHPFLSSFSVHS